MFYSPLADFSTALWGVLKIVDGKIVLDKVKAFNRMQRMLNARARVDEFHNGPCEATEET